MHLRRNMMDFTKEIKISSKIKFHRAKIHMICTNSSLWHHKIILWRVREVIKINQQETHMTCISQQCQTINLQIHMICIRHHLFLNRKIIWISHNMCHYLVARKNWRARVNFNNRKAAISWQTIDPQVLMHSKSVDKELEEAANSWSTTEQEAQAHIK